MIRIAEKIVNVLMADLTARARDIKKWENKSDEEVHAAIRRDWIAMVTKCLEVNNGRSRTEDSK